MKYRKGSTIATWDCYTIIPLFHWNSSQADISLLPKFPSLPDFFSLDRYVSRYDEPNKLFLEKLRTRTDVSDYFVASTVAALHFLTLDTASNLVDRFCSNDTTFDVEDSHFPISLLTQSWKLVRDRISFDHWTCLMASVLRNIHIVTREHPLITYSRDCIPYMSMSELEEIVTILKLDTKCRSSVGIQHMVQQLYRNAAAPTFVAVPSLVSMLYSDQTRNEAPSINTIQHSCLPTAQLELSDNNTISLKAQFDIASDVEVSICYVMDDTVELRDRMLQCRIGQSCLCIRCRYELVTDPVDENNVESNTTMNLSQNDLVRIGHFHMIKEEFETAKRVYRKALHTALAVSVNDMVLPDIYHAMGAVELSMGHFLSAQQIWNDANRDHPELCSRHDGIALQMEKIKSYAYFDEDHCKYATMDTGTILNWDSPAPDCYMASVLGSETCQKVIDWADTFGKWTTKRHYAVPTFDVPIHTVPPLLDWFQNDFMNPIIQPLLAQQFHPSTEGRFYVHDAFCVRYESNHVANHLPIHVDESSHSLVVALNDGFEGGGTYLPDYDIVLNPPKGSVISFRGDTLPHGGQAVTKGVRYILAVFLYYDVHSHTLRDKAPTSTKRDSSEFHQPARKPKQPKTDFSFNFDC